MALRGYWLFCRPGLTVRQWGDLKTPILSLFSKPLWVNTHLGKRIASLIVREREGWRTFRIENGSIFCHGVTVFRTDWIGDWVIHAQSLTNYSARASRLLRLGNKAKPQELDPFFKTSRRGKERKS